jgi:hypothetical protein
MMPGYGETLVCEGDPRVDNERAELLAAFRRQLDEGMWAVVPVTDDRSGRREGVLVTDFAGPPGQSASSSGRAPPAARPARPRAEPGAIGSGLMVMALVLILGLIGVTLGFAGHGTAGSRAAADPPSWLTERPPSPEQSEDRSRDLLWSVVDPEEWQMFHDLGFICVTGRRRARGGRHFERPLRHRYLIHPHLPVVALLPRSMAPVREYCVHFPDRGSAAGSTLLPAGDDVLAKWMTLRADEERLLSFANVSGVGCQVPLERIERDLARLERWTARRAAQKGAEGSSPAAPRSPAGRPSAVSSSMRL